MHPAFEISKDQKKKPAIYKLCDHTKGGTDIVDQNRPNISKMDHNRIFVFA